MVISRTMHPWIHLLVIWLRPYKKFRESNGQPDRQWVFHGKYCKVTFFYQRTRREIRIHWHKQISKGWTISSKEILILVIKPTTFSSTEKYLKMNFLCKPMVIQFTSPKHENLINVKNEISMTAYNFFWGARMGEDTKWNKKHILNDRKQVIQINLL